MVKREQSARCQNRSWELVYDDVTCIDLSLLIKELAGKKYGCLKAFAITHTENKKTHVHVGFILRDKPKDFNWVDVKEYFRIQKTTDHRPQIHVALKDKSKSFDKKLQTYYNYCVDQEKHPDQILSPAYLHKWKPKTEEELLAPSDCLTIKIRDGLTQDDLDELIDSTDTPIKLFKEALKNYDVYVKMIDKLDEIRERKRQATLYQEQTKNYRPFQKALTEVLDSQDDRGIHCHYDNGKTGKNYWLDREGMRPDTLIMQSADTKRIAYAWNPRKHKRIIFDIPRGKMEYVNTSVIEKLKNGTLFSTMHYPKMKKSSFKPSIVILGNEEIGNTWTDDRLTMSTTDDKFDFLKVHLVKGGVY